MSAAVRMEVKEILSCGLTLKLLQLAQGFTRLAPVKILVGKQPAYIPKALPQIVEERAHSSRRLFVLLSFILIEQRASARRLALLPGRFRYLHPAATTPVLLFVRVLLRCRISETFDRCSLHAARVSRKIATCKSSSFTLKYDMRVNRTVVTLNDGVLWNVNARRRGVFTSATESILI